MGQRWMYFRSPITNCRSKNSMRFRRLLTKSEKLFGAQSPSGKSPVQIWKGTRAMTCQNCNKVFADGFAFCPHCGNAASAVSSTAAPIAEIKPTSVDQTDLPSVPERQSPAGGNKVGT